MRIDGNVDVTAYQQPLQRKTEGIKDIPDTTQNQHVAKAEATIKEQEENVKVEKDVIKAIEKANKDIRMYDRRLEFSIHDSTKQIIVKVIDTENDTVIREIPSEKILDMVAYLWQAAGLFVDEKR